MAESWRCTERNISPESSNGPATRLIRAGPTCPRPMTSPLANHVILHRRGERGAMARHQERRTHRDRDTADGREKARPTAGPGERREVRTTGSQNYGKSELREVRTTGSQNYGRSNEETQMAADTSGMAAETTETQSPRPGETASFL